MTAKQYQKACDNFKGYCAKCKKLTRGQCEPDASKYPCPKCKTNNVYGVEEALMIGLLDVSGDIF